MRLAKPSREELEEFFRDEITATHLKLARVRFLTGPFSLLLLKLLRVNGLTIGRFVFVLTEPGRMGRRTISASLTVHELCHVFQYERNGGVSFLTTYFSNYWKGLRRQKKRDATARLLAYLSIPEEIEARAAENNFIQWRRARQQVEPVDEPVTLIANGALEPESYG